MPLVLPQPDTLLFDDDHARMHRVVAVYSDAPEQSVVVNSDGSISLNQMPNRVAKAILALNLAGDKIEYKVVGYELDFIISDWILSGDNYIIDIQHNLDSYYSVVEIRENLRIVFTDEVVNVDQNSLQIYVPADPDLRFDGSIKIII